MRVQALKSLIKVLFPRFLCLFGKIFDEAVTKTTLLQSFLMPLRFYAYVKKRIAFGTFSIDFKFKSNFPLV